MVDERVSVADAASAIGVSRNTIVTMLTDGRLRGVDHGAGQRPRYELNRSTVEQMRGAGGRRRSPNEKVAPVTDDTERSPRRAQTGESPAAYRGDDYEVTIKDLRTEIARLQAENSRLRSVARNANVAVQAQTESLQQYLTPDDPRHI